MNPDVDCTLIKIYHETWIDSGTDISSQRIPTFRIEEVPELPEVMVD